MSVPRRRGGEPSGCGARAVLASRRSDRSPAPSSDRDAGPAIAVASSDTAAVTTTNAHSVPAATSSGPCTTTATASPAATFREHGSCRQSGNHQSEHEHAESCHVAPPP